MATVGNELSRTLVALPDAASRRSLRKIIQDAGYVHCREVATLPLLEEKLAAGEVDLLVTTLNERGWDSGPLIRRIRQGEFGNPFILIMALLDEPSPPVVNRVVNAGADDLLLSPWLERLVLSRLEGLIHARKRFLVTHDYVGPERRQQTRPGAASAQPLDVPNPLHWLTVAKGSRDDLNRAVQQTQSEVNLSKIRSCGNQLRFLADRIVANFAAQGHAAVIPDVATMLAATEELVQRAADTQFAATIELTNGLRTLCQRLVREDRPARAGEIGVLPSLADAVVSAIYSSDPEPVPVALRPAG